MCKELQEALNRTIELNNRREYAITLIQKTMDEHENFQPLTADDFGFKLELDKNGKQVNN